MRRTITKHDLLSVVLMWLPILIGALAATLGASHTQYLSAGGVAATIACWIYFAYVARPRAEWLARMNAVTGALIHALDQPTPNVPDANTDPIELTNSLQEAADAISSQATRATAATANLRSVFDNSSSAIIATDDAGVIVLANNAASTLFARRSFDRLSIENIFTRADVLDQHAQALRGKATVSQVRIARPPTSAVSAPDGPRIYQVLAAPLPLILVSDSLAKRSVSGAIVTLRDVTELAQALQLKTDFVANASHELRTPLASIRGAIETLADGGWEEPALRDRLSTMVTTNVERLEELVRDLLDLSRLETPDSPDALGPPGASVTREPISLRALCESLRDTFEDAAVRRSLTISVEIDPVADAITSDRKLLSLILRNLIENATKFAYEGTTIRIAAHKRDNTTVIEVIDRGVGIPLAQQSRIFERFFQVDPSRTPRPRAAAPAAPPAAPGADSRAQSRDPLPPPRGTGLGLSIAKHAVKTLGGTISVESVWGEGTTMRVELPPPEQKK